MDMRGLAHFIQDIRRATTSLEKEQQRIDLELSKIRAKFMDSATMSTYNRRKYVCKLMFIAMLGYPVAFGHMEGVKLLACQGPADKLIGYLSVTVFLHEHHELMTLTTHVVHRDLISGKEFNVGLALTAIANAGGSDFAEVMTEDVKLCIVSSTFDIHLRKKALLTYLRLFRKNPEVADMTEVLPMAVRFISHEHFGLANCAISLVTAVLGDQQCAASHPAPLCEEVLDRCLTLLQKIIIEKSTDADYIYYGVPAPWLQAKLFRLLQFCPCPPATSPKRRHIDEIMEKVISATTKVLLDAQTQMRIRGTQNRCNAMNAILYECMSTIIVWSHSDKLLSQATDVLSDFITHKRDSNQRYLGLSLLMRLQYATLPSYDFSQKCQPFQPNVIVALHDPDVTLRQRALGATYALCTPENVDSIMGELLSYLPLAETAFKRDLVLMIAILSEKFATNLGDYVENIIRVIIHTEHHVPKEVWHHAIHLVVNNPPVQKQAVACVFHALTQRVKCPDILIKVGAILLGEYGFQIAMEADSNPLAQFHVLQGQLPLSNDDAKAYILTALAKFYNLFDNTPLREKIIKVLQTFSSCFVVDLQQRATEYLSLLQSGDDELLQAAFAPLPPFELASRHAMKELMRDRRQPVADRDIWTEKAVARDAAEKAEESPSLTPSNGLRTRSHSRDSSKLNSPVEMADGRGRGEAGHRAGERGTGSFIRPIKAQPPQNPKPLFLASGTALTNLNTSTFMTPRSFSMSLSTSDLGVLPRTVPAGKKSEGASSKELDALFRITRPEALEGEDVTQSRLRQLFAQLTVHPSGLLFENADLRLYCVHKYRVADGRLSLQVVNKRHTPLEGLHLTVLSQPTSLMLQHRPYATVVPPQPADAQAPAPFTGEAAGASAVVIEFAGRSLGPFAEAPIVRLQYQTTATRSADGPAAAAGGVPPPIILSLPMVTTRFITPYPLQDHSSFAALWGHTVSGDKRYSTPHVLRLQLPPTDAATAGHGTGVLDYVQTVLQDALQLKTRLASASVLLAAGAHATYPRDSPEYTPLLLRVELHGQTSATLASDSTPPFGTIPGTATLAAETEVHVSILSSSAVLQKAVLDVLTSVMCETVGGA